MTATQHEAVAELERANAALQRQLDEYRAERDAAMAGQAAMAEVLDAINSSPGDPLPVFEVILDKAHKLCGSAVGSLMTFDGEHFRAVATRGFPERHAAIVRRPFRPNSHHRQLMGGERLVHIPDVTELEIGSDDAVERSTIDRTDVRTLLAVPLRKDGVFFGYISAFRHEVRPFSKNEIALLENFATQAVIAMENARLLAEQREALEQQTATADVLQIINGSPGDLAPVFDIMLEKAMRLCGAAFGNLSIFDGKAFHCVGMRGVTPALAEFLREPMPMKEEHGSVLFRIVHGEDAIHQADITDDDVYRSGLRSRRVLADLGGARTRLMVALRKEDKLLGVFNIYRREVRPFTDRQVELVRNFAAQAVIAMENARLITEQREALEQQTATAEVLQVINASPGILTPVFDAILEKAHSLCGAAMGALATYDGTNFRAVATRGYTEGHDAVIRQPFAPNNFHQALMRGERLAHIADIRTIDIGQHPISRSVVENTDMRTCATVPLRKDGLLLGFISAWRLEVRPFSEKEIALLENFAAQAVIAMENARLLDELRQRTGDLEESLEYQTATSDVLKVISRSTFDLQPVLDTLVQTAARLCEADTAGISTRDSDQYRVVAVWSGTPEFGTFIRGRTFAPNRTSVTGRTVLEGQVVHVADLTADPEYTVTEAVTLGGVRTLLGVPLLREGQVVGVINLGLMRVQPFSDRQIELVRTFADQAVIAIENVRLLTEQREALEQQTATAEVLQVINASPGNLMPVFQAIVEKAHILCDAAYGSLQLCDGEKFRGVAMRGFSGPMVERLQLGYSPWTNMPCRRLVEGERVAHCADLAEIDDPTAHIGVALGGVRTVLYVALRKEDVLLGQIVAARQEVRPFTEKQIALVESFAAQAVIAMENARLITEQREALEQQTATAELLQVINCSPGNLAPVFAAILNKAHTVCGAVMGSLQIWDGTHARAVATLGYPDNIDAVLRQPAPPPPRHLRLIAGDRLSHISDITQLGDARNQATQEFRDRTGIRTSLIVPLRRDGALLGFITANRREVRSFTSKEIALLENFAAQAVIAMENARLITEQREALEQQTATAEVLQVINASPGDLVPVFDAMLERAMRLCEAGFGSLYTYDGERFNSAAQRGVPPAYAAYRASNPPTLVPGSGTERLVATKQVHHVLDVRERDLYRTCDPGARAMVDLGGIRTLLSVPLVKDDVLLGYISIYRQEVRAFSDKQIALLENFAAQAVIAMENARLIVEQREALERQTATAEVLEVINTSPGNLDPVFDAVLEKAMRLCGAAFGSFYTYDGAQFHSAAQRGVPAAYAGFRAHNPPRPLPSGTFARALDTRRTLQVLDLMTEELYLDGNPGTRAMVELGGVRTILTVPLGKDESVLGLITVYRQEVRAFSEKQIALLENFASQAVIAMENARLLSELRERTDELAQRQAELRVTFENMGDGVAMFDETPRLVAWNRRFLEIFNVPKALLEEHQTFAEYIRFLAERGDYGPNVDPEDQVRRLTANAFQQHTYERTRPDGKVIEIRHNPVAGGGFVMIFSDITERKRNEAEIHAAREAAEAAYRELKATQANLIQAEKMVSLGQLTAGIAHEIKNPLNFVNNFSILSVELLDELRQAVDPVLPALDENMRAELGEIVGMLTSNLEKITEHGRRADGIVRSMLEHSRGGSGDRRRIDLNTLVEEALNLAYHGARAQDQSFNITLRRDLAEAIAPIDLVPQDVTRVLLNLFSNGFYAAHKRRVSETVSTFEPTLEVTTRDLGDAVEIRVRDNGTGIPAEIRDKLFQPFFTTKPTGEGTGLGLSISYDIVTQQHGGAITVDSRVGEYSEFTIRLPRER